MRLCPVLAMAAGLLAGMWAAQAQQPPLSADELRRASRAEFERLQADIRVTDERMAALKADVARLDQDRQRLSDQLLASAERARKLETGMTEAEAEIDRLDGQTATVAASLQARRAVLIEVIAGLQRMGANPPPAVLVRPEDALTAVRSAILMGAVVPELRGEAQKLATDLKALSSLKQQSVRARDVYRGDLSALKEERARLDLLLAERRKAMAEQQKSFDEERRKAQEMASRATSLKELIAKAETDLDSARKAAQAAEESRRKSEEAQKSPSPVPPAADPAEPPKQQASLGDPAKMQPSRPFADLRGQLRLPAAGSVQRQFGEDDGSGLNLKGIQLTTRPKATVTSPADGWVVYAGTFRSYGKVLIINGGGGYHMVLAGMDRIDAEIGQLVLGGEPIGEMGERRAGALPNTDTKTAQPVLYVEFRKDGTPFDPGPWWGPTKDEKGRG